MPDTDHAELVAQGLMAQVVGRRALTHAFDEIFAFMAVMFAVALIMVPFCSKTTPSGEPNRLPEGAE